MTNTRGKRGIGFYLTATATVLTVIALIAYIMNGSAIRSINTGVVVLLVLAALGEGITLWKPFYGIGVMLAAVLLGAAMGYYLSFSADYLGYLFTGVIGNYASTMASFLTFAIATVASIVLTIVTSFMSTED